MVSGRKDPTNGSIQTPSNCVVHHRQYGRAVASLGVTIPVFFAAAELSKKTTKTQVSILLHCAGPEAQDIYTNFVFANTDDDKDSNWEHVLKKFRDYCEPRKNEFWQRDQREGELIDQWVNYL